MGLGADKRRQERVMNIDDGLRILHDEICREHLHVTRQDNQIDVVCVEKLDLLRFRLGLAFLRYRNVMEGYAKEIGVASGVEMVADHQGKIAGEFPIALAMKQIHQAVVVLGNEDGHAWPAIAQREHPVHAELVCDWAERSIEIMQVQAE